MHGFLIHHYVHHEGAIQRPDVLPVQYCQLEFLPSSSVFYLEMAISILPRLLELQARGASSVSEGPGEHGRGIPSLHAAHVR